MADAAIQPYRLVSSETVPLTREAVDEQRNLPASPTERELNPKRLTFLRERFESGLFHPPHWVRAKVGTTMMRANGMHSSSMLSQLDGSFPVGMFVHIDTFDCADMDSLAMLFRQFDARQSARSPADVAGAYQGLRVELAEVPKNVGKLGVEAIAWHQRTVEGQKDTPSGDDQYTLFNQTAQHPFLLWLGELFPTGVPSDLGKPPIVAAMYATFGSDADASDDFWREIVKGGREYEDEYPTSVLADWLKQAHHKETIVVKPKGMYQGAIYAWNAARDGKTALSSIKCDVQTSRRKQFNKVR